MHCLDVQSAAKNGRCLGGLSRRIKQARNRRKSVLITLEQTVQHTEHRQGIRGCEIALAFGCITSRQGRQSRRIWEQNKTSVHQYLLAVVKKPSLINKLVYQLTVSRELNVQGSQPLSLCLYMPPFSRLLSKTKCYQSHGQHQHHTTLVVTRQGSQRWCRLQRRLHPETVVILSVGVDALIRLSLHPNDTHAHAHAHAHAQCAASCACEYAHALCSAHAYT